MHFINKFYYYFVMISQNPRGFRKETSKPVNINISFTINPKNILNNPQLQNQVQGRKLMKDNDYVALYNNARTPSYARTPDPNADLKMRQNNNDNPKSKRNTKRNSVDESTFRQGKHNQCNKSLTLRKFAETVHIRKSSTKSKKVADNSARKHNKTASNFTRNIDRYAVNSVIIEGGGAMQHKISLQKNLKKMINHIVTNQLSKRSLPLQLPNTGSISRRVTHKKKSKRRSPKKANKSLTMLHNHNSNNSNNSNNNNENWINPIDRQKLIEKLTSFRSMNNSLFVSQTDQEVHLIDRKSIVVNTDQSIECIDEIHELQTSQRYRNLNKFPMKNNNEGKSQETIQLIETYIAILNEHIQYEGQVSDNHPDSQINRNRKESLQIDKEFEMYRKTDIHHKQSNQQFQKRQQQLQQSQSSSQHSQQLQYQEQRQESLAKNSHSNNMKQHQSQIINSKRNKKPQQDALRPFCSSEMTKQQKLINELQRIKLNELKKHEVEKWEQLLIFMKLSMQNGEVDSQQILQSVYTFLEKTRNDLQHEINTNQLQPHSKQLSDIDAFTNKLTSNNGDEHLLQKDNRQLLPIHSHNKERNKDNHLQFDDISSMSFKDEDYEEQNQQLKIVNLQIIDNALKARYEGLVAKREKQLANLEEKRNINKITEIDFILEKDKLDKWTKQQTSSIAQARKNIWKGYSEAKGILQKSARSKLFESQFESGKKKSMMKCLSEDYLLKKGINLLSDKKKQSEASEEHSSINNNLQIQNNSSLSYNRIYDNHKQPEQYSNEVSQTQQVNSESSYDINSQNDAKNTIQQAQQLQQTKQVKQVKHKQKISESDNQSSELNTLKNQQDIDIIREKLKSIKQKHLKQDKKQPSYSNEQQSPNMSYEQVPNQLHEQSYSDQQLNIMKSQFQLKKIQPLQSHLINQQINTDNDNSIGKNQFEKLKYVCAEDKQDIFQFIFLDLSIQLYQQTCSDNKFMNAINKYVTNAKKQASKKKGVKTNLNVVKEYLRRFTNFILRTNKDVLNSIDQPVGPTALQMLKYMHENDDDQPARQQEETISTLIIPSTIFDQFQRQLLPSIQFEVYYENDEQREVKRVQFLRSVLHIHNKALFDGLNQFLDTLRPYGIWGKPFPWKKPSSFLRDTTHEKKQQKLKKGAEKVAEYCSYVCGLLTDKQQSLVGNARLSEDYLDQIKQDRLSRMLATELIDNEERWLFYDDEETEVLVELSTAFYRIMVKEAAHEVLLILNKGKHQ